MSIVPDNYIPKSTGSGDNLIGLEQSNIYSDDSGKVGIGTASPGSKLSIYGNDGVNTATFEINTKQVGTASFQRIVYIGPTGSSVNDGYLQLSDNNTVKVNIAANNSRGGATYFNGGGNVGIGTNDPSRMLTIDHSSDPTLGLYTGGMERVTLRTDTSSNFRIDVGGTERMRIDSNGKVGIGTNSQTAQLNVKAGSASTIGMIVNTPDSPTANIAEFQQNGNTKVVITKDGNVGIGVTDFQDTKLGVVTTNACAIYAYSHYNGSNGIGISGMADFGTGVAGGTNSSDGIAVHSVTASLKATRFSK